MTFSTRFAQALIALSLLFSLCAGQNASAAGVKANKIRFTTFNVEWFGLGGDLKGSPSDEYRDDSIKNFIAEHLMPTDVIAFQEIVDVPRLESLLPNGWKCLTYNHKASNHQHVALCASNKFHFENVGYDNNETIETVAIDPARSRPALRVNLINHKTNKPLITVVAVHLKAYPTESKTRLKQAALIAQDLKDNDPKLPVVILGDFNTYSKSQNGEKADDADLIEKALIDVIPDFTHVQHTDKYTYRSGKYLSQFDHIYLSGAVEAISKPEVFKVCNQPKQTNDYFDIEFYNKNVSDHCPVSVDLAVIKQTGATL